MGGIYFQMTEDEGADHFVHISAGQQLADDLNSSDTII